MSNTRKVPREVIDFVREKRVLFAACAYTVNEFDKGSINFTVPIFVQTYSFLTSKPRQLSRALLFASPFTKEVGICGALIFIQVKASRFFFIIGSNHSPLCFKSFHNGFGIPTRNST